MTSDDPKVLYPLHFHVWNNDYMALDELLHQKKHDIEKLDSHGRTPLMLCVMLDHLESARVLLRHGANACVSTNEFWSATQEAIATGDPELVKLILVHRDAQIVRHQAAIVTDLLQKLRETPDFYIEMKWEFTSWLPLVSRMCPSDVCRVWKCGPNVRIDTNLLGFNGSASWVRGHLSYMFRAGESGAYMDEVNHTDRTIYRHNVNLLNRPDGTDGASGAGATAGAAAQLFVREPSDSTIANKLTQPIFVTYLDTDKIEFEKSKSGILGWRSDRKETINNHACQVYCASNVQIITLRRTEHLTEENLRDLNQQHHSNDSDNGSGGGLIGAPASDIVFPGGRGNLLTNLLQTAASETEKKSELAVTHEAASYNPNHVTPQQYFCPSPGAQSVLYDIGRPKVMTTKVKTFKARLWICRDYPLSLKDQIIPIIDLMSEYNPYFHKLKEFLTKQLPSGFPLKIEIPLYHVLNACVSFGNLHGQDNSVYGVSVVPTGGSNPSQQTSDPHKKTDVSSTAKSSTAASSSDDPGNQPLLDSSTESGSSSQPVKCVIDESVFDVGKGYHVIVENSPGHYGALYDEEQMVQMAVQRSLVEYGSAENLIQRGYSLSKRSIIETRADEYVEPEEAWLQQAIAASLNLDGAEIPVTSADAAYMKALEESRIEQELEEKRRRAEDEELARILELSTKEK
ncbi:unnamed protein product [Trichobilharzia szidati]|nr:unnamed protein product [Trichobilharzia szidati]CAH8831531.1 unnamed protein product [Trichobilharzia szidati]